MVGDGDDIRLDLELAADAEIDRQLQTPHPIALSPKARFNKRISQVVTYRNCTDARVPRGIFEVRCIARGFRPGFLGIGVNDDDTFFTR